MYKIHSWVMLLSPPQASFCREAGQKEKGGARSTMGRGREKRGLLPPFPLPIVPRALSIFSIIYCYFYWDTQGKPLRRREVMLHFLSLFLSSALSVRVTVIGNLLILRISL